MATKFLNYRGVKREGQVSWTVHAGFVVIFAVLYLTVFTWIKTIFGIIILGGCCFAVSYLLLNKHPVHMLLIIKAYFRDSSMEPTPIDTLKVNGLREVPSLNRVLDILNKQKK